MASNTFIAEVKTALRVVNPAFDAEIDNLIEAALEDLQIAGVVLPETMTPIVKDAVITFVKMRFGAPEEFDRLKRSYDESKAQLVTASGYTDWGDIDG